MNCRSPVYSCSAAPQANLQFLPARLGSVVSVCLHQRRRYYYAASTRSVALLIAIPSAFRHRAERMAVCGHDEEKVALLLGDLESYGSLNTADNHQLVEVKPLRYGELGYLDALGWRAPVKSIRLTACILD